MVRRRLLSRRSLDRRPEGLPPNAATRPATEASESFRNETSTALLGVAWSIRRQPPTSASASRTCALCCAHGTRGRRRGALRSRGGRTSALADRSPHRYAPTDGTDHRFEPRARLHLSPPASRGRNACTPYARRGTFGNASRGPKWGRNSRRISGGPGSCSGLLPDGKQLFFGHRAIRRHRHLLGIRGLARPLGSWKATFFQPLVYRLRRDVQEIANGLEASDG